MARWVIATIAAMSAPLLPGTRVAEGRTAEIFRLEEGQVLKLFRPGWGEGDARYEADKAEAVHAAGLPVPTVYGVTQVNGRFGIVYEEIVGRPLMESLKNRPWAVREAARLLADLHLQVHKARIPALPSLKDHVTRTIEKAFELTAEQRAALLSLLSRLSEGDALCHGDFHPGNVYLTERGPIVLDWMDAARGNPLADVARTSVLFRAAVLPRDMPGRRGGELIRRAFHRVYLRRYLAKTPSAPGQLAVWIAVVAGARLAERIPGEEKRLLGLVADGLRSGPRMISGAHT